VWSGGSVEDLDSIQFLLEEVAMHINYTVLKKRIRETRSFLGGIAIAVFLVICRNAYVESFGQNDTSMKIVGAIFQTLGIVIIVYELNEKFRELINITIIGSLKNWLVSCREAFQKHHVIGLVTAFVGSPTMRAKGSIGYPTADTLMGRVDIIESRLADLDWRVDAVQEKMKQDSDYVEKEIRQIKTDLKREIENLLLLVRRVSIGGSQLQIVGLFYVLIGTWIDAFT
jgi:hypothetical protein